MTIPDYRCVKGIIFDLDGTLYRMQWYMRPLLTIMLFPNILRLPRFLKIRGQFAGINLHSYDSLIEKISTQLAVSEKIKEPATKKWIEKDFYNAFIKVMTFLKKSRPHVNDILRIAKNKGFKLAVLSDYDKIPDRLDKLHIDKSVFDIMTSSEAHGALKPSPIPFLEIASSWNLTPGEILVIGDRDDTDGEAARLAGMQFIHIDDKIRTIDKNRMSWDHTIIYLKTTILNNR